MSLPFERHLGKNGPVLPAIGLGCMGLSSKMYGDADTAEVEAVLDRARELGIKLWDTADIYGMSIGEMKGMGGNEKLLGEYIRRKGARKDVFLATKFGCVFPDGKIGVNGRAEYVAEAAGRSEERLDLGGPIDLYYLHRTDRDTPIEETVGAMAQLVKEGKIRYIGLSEVSAEDLRKAHAVHPITAVQMEYNPWCLEIERTGVLEACRELGIAVVAYSPLGRGMMTGRYRSVDDFAADDLRRMYPRFQGEAFAKNLEILSRFEAFAERKGCTPGQACLAWILAQGPEFFVIPGTKRVKYLEENWAAKDVVLTPEEVAEIRALAEEATVIGERSPAAFASGHPDQ